MENIMWSLTGTGKSKRNFVSSSNQTCDHSTQGRPDYMRLDSSGQTIRDEDIPTVKPPGVSTPASSTPDMAGHQRQNPHSHHTGKYSHRHTCNHLNQGRMGFHQTSTTTPNNHNNNYFANFNGHLRPHLYQAPRVPGFGYFPLAEKHNHHFNNYNLPFQFGTGTDYNFNPQPYPWSMAPRFKGQMISPQAVHTRTTPPPAQVMQNQHHHHHHSQRPAHQRNFHRQRQHGYQGPPNQQRNCDNNKRQKSYSQVKETPSDATKPRVALETTTAAAVKKDVTMENSSPETMSPPKVDSDVIINLKAMTISSDNMASGCIQVGATPEIKQSGNNDSASMSKSQQTSTGCPPTERKSVTVSVRSFFTPIQCTEKKSPGDKAVTADKNTESCDKSDQIEVEKPSDVPIKQKSGLQSELDVIKDTFLNCDNIDNENTDSGLGLEEERKENVEVPVRKNLHIGSFRIHAIYSPNNTEIQKSADDSLAGVHSSSPKPCASTETQEFSARVFLTPKTDCLAGAPARRKHRPSAKKRRRQRSQRSENQPCDAALKKQKTQTGGASTSRGIPIPKPRKFEFYVDVSDSQDCESDVGSPSKASPEIKSSPQSPCISKFAFVIRPSEQYSDSESGSWTESDDDGFDSDDDDDDDADGGDFDQDLWNSFNITCSFSSPLACLAAPVESASPTASALPDPPCSDTPDSEPRPCITEANQKWEKLYAHIDTDKPKPETPRKVLFAESSDLATVHVEESEMADAYRDARKGDWESYARDRCRFRSRVEAFQTLISPFHQSEHRASVYNRYHAEQDN